MTKQNALDRAHPGLVAAAPRAIEKKEISISDLVAMLRRRRRWILVATLVSLGLGILYCCVRTPRYEAVSDLAIHPEGSDALDIGDLSSMATGGGGLDWNAKLETQVRILKSQTLAWTTISDLRLDRQPGFGGQRKHRFFGELIVPPAPANIESTDPKQRNHWIGEFQQLLTVATIPRTQAVEIKFRSTDPALAANVVNQLASAYLEHNFMTRYDATEQASDWLAKQLNDLRDDVESSQNKLADFQKKTGIIGADDDDNLILNKLDAIDKQLTDAKADRIVTEAKYHLASTGNPELIGTVVPDSVLPDLRSQEADLKNQLAQAQSIYGPNYPKVIQLKTQLSQVDDELAKEIQDIKERFHTEYEASSSVEGQLQTAFDQQEQAAYKLSGDMSQYGILKRNVESERDLYEDLLKKLKEAGVMAGLRSTNVDIIDKATLPTKPVDPNVPLVILLSLFFGLGSGLGLAFWAESVDSSVRGAEEIEAIVGLPILGTVPHFTLTANGRNRQMRQLPPVPSDSSRHRSPVTVLRPNSEASEAFRSIRTSVLLSSAGTPPKTVLVASGLPGDGKSTISTNMAVVLAQRGARVLLVDADLRRGTLGQTLGLPKNTGLCGALTSSCTWREAVEPVAGVDSLFVLQGGLRPPNPADLLGSATMDTLLAEWRNEFDQVIIDSPPCLVVTDGVMLAPKMDAILLVARIDHTPRLGVRRTVDLLQSVDATIAGIVLNDFSMAGTYYGYGYGYRYGHSSKYYDDPKEAVQNA